MAVFDADVVCGIEPMQSALKHSCQLPSVRARTGFAATDDAVGVAGSLFGDSNGPEPGEKLNLQVQLASLPVYRVCCRHEAAKDL